MEKEKELRVHEYKRKWHKSEHKKKITGQHEKSIRNIFNPT